MTKRGAVYMPPIDIASIYSTRELADLLVIARRRVVEGFLHATEMTRGRKRSTGNIIRTDSRPKDLARYVRHEEHGITDPRGLPDDLHPWAHTTGERQQMAEMIDYQLVTAVILQMREDNEIWYDEFGCYWSILVTQIDRYHEEARRAHRVKFDRRNEHGKVRSQRKQRGLMAGSSVAMTGPGSSSQAA